ncbi:MAG: DNA helicase RecQ [Oscillospiraceae bacterium]|jgi:ATP-dependent DNA helicase RecQ|nr:DNA helicase RecQ [Oscillospiraceae bacterium]
MINKYSVLKQHFGHSSFRGGQGELIDAVLGGRDVFGIMPTGGGKSLCYQIPAVIADGITLVVSPLISLMKDQVSALKQAEIKAAYINSSLTSMQLRTVYRRMRGGEYKIVYVAPERLLGEGFVALAQELKISMVAVDEAHCISQWGQDFRPSYLKIVEFLDKLPGRPVLAAFTATATPQVSEDIKRILKLRGPLCLITGFDRPNLNFEVLRPSHKLNALYAILDKHSSQSGIVYCSTRKAVERVFDELGNAGIAATRYHAGLSDEERRVNQDDFLYDRRTVMVATNAFGMGIDKSNVSFVVHYNMPKSIEAYYQEAGRAGRDGEKADCVLLFSPGDVTTAKFLIQNSDENNELSIEERQLVMQQDLRRLEDMIGYCKTTACLRGYILNYFGQQHGAYCTNCGNCRSNYSLRDITNESRMILSCVKRVKDKLGYPVGATLIVRCLRGSADKRLLELGLDKLTTYGLMRAISKHQIRRYIEHLESVGYISTDSVFGGVDLAPAAGDVLFRGKEVHMPEREVPAETKRRDRKAATVDLEGDADLFSALKTLRSKIASQEKLPAYIVFSNANLADMARKAPKTMDEFMGVSGVGRAKAARYGEAFLAAIALYLGTVKQGNGDNA